MNFHLRELAFLALAGLLAGCATSGVSNAHLATAPVPADKARLTITRIDEFFAMAVPASIDINGKRAADVGVGASTTIDIAPGANVISVSGWSYPGAYSLTLDAKPGQRYAVEVSIRSGSMLPGLALGPVGAIIDASVNENAGQFQMRFVDAKGPGA
jgi:hypothetical protein